MQTERRAEIACAVLLAAVIALMHSPGLLGKARLTAHHDNLDGGAPLRVEAARQWRSGNVPLWNPWKRAGMPLLADTTAGAIYPGNLPFLLSDPEPAGPDESPVFRALDAVAAINAILGGVFMFVFLRGLSLSNAASLFGGVVWACNGTMVWLAAWYIQIQSSVVWLPLILAAVRGAAAGVARARWIAVGALAVALQFFAGFPETSFYSGVLAIAFAASLAERARALTGVAAIYVGGILLAAVQLFPSLELQSLSRRPGELSLEAFQSLPASIDMVAAWVVPTGEAHWEFLPDAAYYFSAIAVFAAVVGTIAYARRAAFFVVVLAVGMLLALGAATPVNALLHELPVFRAFRHPFKHLFEVSFAMSVLAAFGMHRLSGARAPGAVRSKVATVLRQSVAMLATAVTSLLLLFNQVVLFGANSPGVDTSGQRPDDAAKIAAGWRVLAARQVFQKRSPRMLIGDYPSQFGVAAIHGAGPFLWSPLAHATGMIEEEITFRPGLFDARDRTLALLAGRYVLQTRQKTGFVPALDVAPSSIVAETIETRLVERAGALPRIRFVGGVRCASAAEIDESLRGGGPDPADVALLDCAGPMEKSFPSSASPEARIVREEPAHLVLETSVPGTAGAFLVVSQSDFPGWRAWVDEKSTLIRRVHGLVQGIELPPGAKRVELRYLPVPFFAGAAISAATMLVLALRAFAEGRRLRS